MSLALLTPSSPFVGEATDKIPVHQQVYERLRGMLLFGDLAPGQAVTIQGLTQTLGVGMTPVREALRRLVAEGALTLRGNRRVMVPLLTGIGLENLDFMRKSLEPELTRRATLRMNSDDLEHLHRCDADLNQAIQQGDVGGYLTHNYRFHAFIYARAEAPIMATTVDQLWLRFGPSLRVVCGRFGTSNLPDKHQALLAAFAARDVEAAATAMQEDVSQGILQIRSAMQEDQAADRFD